MYDRERLLKLKEKVEDNLNQSIMKFWTRDDIRDPENGGFYGMVYRNMEHANEMDRFLVLYGRMVYAYSNAYKIFGREKYAECAKYTFDYLADKFSDKEYGGAFAEIDTQGNVTSDEKSAYSEAFFVMGCASYYDAFHDQRAYDLGMQTFNLMEGTKKRPGVYPNNLDRDWSEKTTPSKRFNFGEGTIVFPHHLCQSYEMLYRATGEPKVKQALTELLEFAVNYCFDPETKCFITMVTEDGKPTGPMGRTGMMSFGHDCELSYLLYDVACLVERPDLAEKIVENTKIALDNVLEYGIGPYHGMYDSYDCETQKVSGSHTWWVEAECIMAMLYGYEVTGKEAYLDAAEKQLNFIETYMTDEVNGDWWSIITMADGQPQFIDRGYGPYKLSSGKCPFHNSHMCIDVSRRIQKMLA